MRTFLLSLVLAASLSAQFSFIAPRLVSVTESSSGFKGYTFAIQNPLGAENVNIVSPMFLNPIPLNRFSTAGSCQPLITVADVRRRSIQGVDQTGRSYLASWPQNKVLTTADPCSFDLSQFNAEIKPEDPLTLYLTISVAIQPGGPTKEAWLFANTIGSFGVIFQPFICDGVNVSGGGQSAGCPSVTTVKFSDSVRYAKDGGVFINEHRADDDVAQVLKRLREGPLQEGPTE